MNIILFPTYMVIGFFKAMAGACAPTKKGVELDSMIAAVKDLLPELGEGFVEVCFTQKYFFLVQLTTSSIDLLPGYLIVNCEPMHEYLSDT